MVNGSRHQGCTNNYVEPIAMSRFLKRKIGIAFWALAIVAVAFGIKPIVDATGTQGDGSLLGFFTGARDHLTAQDHSFGVRANDPIFFQEKDGPWRQIGYVTSAISEKATDGKGSSRNVQLTWYGSDVPADECELFLYRSTGDLQEVLATMLPPEKRLRIQQRLATAMSQHGDDLSKSFVPLVQESLKRSMPVIEEEFRIAVERHRPELDQLADRWNDEIVGKRLIPLAKQQIMPIVQKHGQPPAEEIGQEIWNRASLWRFGWRAVYDKTPFTDKGLVEKEWKRFVKQEAVPVIEAKMDDIVSAVQKIVGDVASNSEVRREIAGVATELAKDPKARALVRKILKETLIDNDRLRDVWSEVWSSEEASAALDMAGDRLEPVVRSIGDELFGSEDTGINPDFARVLRSQILGKDRQWIVAWHTGSESSGRIETSGKHMPYPVVYEAKTENSTKQARPADANVAPKAAITIENGKGK